jgi:1-acyl-sn-glycerol-3-phosphate acyltransferase
MKWLLRLALRLLGWRNLGKPPGVDRCVMVAFPHTSNWDVVCLIAYGILEDVPVRFAIKDTWMRGPLGPLLKWLGGLAIDRSARGHQVELMAEALLSESRCVLCFTPEGTRGRAEHWKTGFYYTALKAKVPLFLAYVNGPDKCFGTGPLIWPSGDLEQDFQQLREFFEPISGIHREGTSPILLRPSGPNESGLDRSANQ